VTGVPTAAQQDQWRLLDVQAHDTRLAQLAHRRRTLPELAEIERLTMRRRVLADEIVAARTLTSDLRRELTKAEADVEQVRSRVARNNARLQAGQGTAKDMQAMQHELGSLGERQSVLEDAELEVMERLETADARVSQLEGQAGELDGELATLGKRRDEAFAAIDGEASSERNARADAAAGIPADLLSLYEKIRDAQGGVGAARLYQHRCEGCRLELTPTELGRMKAAGDDAVLRCEECGRILVRTPDSGL
jgi:predicted  nucleic acid-binding Zn-ribbon protein